MSKYIDGEWLKELYKPYESYEGRKLAVPIGAILANIDDAPSIDIVRCGECKWYEDPKHKIFENCVKWKESHGILLPMKPNDSCSYAEREGE